MSLIGEAAPPRRRVWRRLAQIAALLAVVIALTLAVLVIYLRPIAEHELALALGTPVTLESLSIRPGRSLIEAKGLMLGPADAHLSAAQMTIAIDVWQLLRGSITVDEVDCTGLVAAVAIDPSYHVTVTGLPIPVRDRTAPSATAALARRVQIRRLVASDATITVRHAIQGKSQDVAVHFDNL